MLSYIRIASLQGLYQGSGCLHVPRIALRCFGQPGDTLSPTPCFLQGAQGRAQEQIRVSLSRPGEREAHRGGRIGISLASRLFRDQLLDPERRPASPGLVGPAQNDDELVTPVMECTLPAPESLADSPQKPVPRCKIVGAAVETKPVQAYGQDRKRPTVGELSPKNPIKRRAVRQPRELVQPARSLVHVLQSRGHPLGEQSQGALLLGPEPLASEDHGPPPLTLLRPAYGHRHEALYTVYRLLAAHDLPFAATPQHQALDRGVPPAGTGVEIPLQNRPMVVSAQSGDVRVRSPAYRMGRLSRPLQNAFETQKLQRRPEPRDQALGPLDVAPLGGEGRSEPAGEPPVTVHLGACQPCDHAEERQESRSQPHRRGPERPGIARDNRRDQVSTNHRGGRCGDLRAGLDPEYPQCRQEVQEEERRALTPGSGYQHADEHGVQHGVREPLSREHLR